MNVRGNETSLMRAFSHERRRPDSIATVGGAFQADAGNTSLAWKLDAIGAMLLAAREVHSGQMTGETAAEIQRAHEAICRAILRAGDKPPAALPAAPIEKPALEI